MKKVLIIAPDFYPNNTGFANATKNLIEAVKKFDSNFAFFVYTPSASELDKEYDNATVFRTKYNRIIYAQKQYKEVCKIIEKHEIELILFETNTFPFLQDKILRKYGSRVAVRIHSTADTEVMVYKNDLRGIKGKIIKKLVTSFMRKCENIICTNSYHQQFVFDEFYKRNVYIMWSKNHFLLPNTVDVSSSEPFAGDYIFTLGKLSYDGFLQKGISDFLCALFLLKRRNVFAKAVVVGDGAFRSKVQDMIDRLGLEEQIQLIPSLSHSEVIEYIKKAKVVCLASRYEGQSMFATEALACGKPLILTTDNGMRDMIDEGLNGFSLKTGNSNDISDKIEAIINFDDASIIKMGVHSRELFEKLYSQESIYHQFVYIYSVIINRRS